MLYISIWISDKINYIANQWKRKGESFYLFSNKPAIWQITADEKAKHSIELVTKPTIILQRIRPSLPYNK